MAASETTALQINYKLPDGTLVNVYAKDQAHLEGLLTSISDLSTLIQATATQLGANTTSSGRIANMTQQLGATEVSADKQCRHGAMIYKTGTNAKGAWKAWMCSAGQKDPSRCEPVWVK